MKQIKYNIKKIDGFEQTLYLSPETWEKFKEVGDNELYEKHNGYSDYSELRIDFNEEGIDMEAHCCIEDDEQSNGE